jgi:hypothetical protein
MAGTSPAKTTFVWLDTSPKNAWYAKQFSPDCAYKYCEIPHAGPGLLPSGGCSETAQDVWIKRTLLVLLMGIISIVPCSSG